MWKNKCDNSSKKCFYIFDCLVLQIQNKKERKKRGISGLKYLSLTEIEDKESKVGRC